MRILGFIGILALLCVAVVGLTVAVGSRDWKGIALMLFAFGMLAVFAMTLWRGARLEKRGSSRPKLADGWYGESVTAFFKNQVAKSPEGRVLLVGSALSLALAALALVSPSTIGLSASRSGVNATLFGLWPILAFVGYIRVCGPSFASSPIKVVAMFCIVMVPLVIAYK